MSNGLIEREKISSIINNIKTKAGSNNSITFDDAIELVNGFSNAVSYPINYTYWTTTSSSLSSYVSSRSFTSSTIFKTGKPFLGWYRCGTGSSFPISVFYFDGSSYTFLIRGYISSITTPTSAGKITVRYNGTATLKQSNTDGTAGKPYFIVFYTKDW